MMSSALMQRPAQRTVCWVNKIVLLYLVTIRIGVEGVDSADWRDTYGVKSDGKGLTLSFVTQGPYSTNIGSRMYLLAPGGDEYQIFKLKNKEFTFDVDVSQLPCGLNGALYFVEMDYDGGMENYPTNTVIFFIIFLM